MTIFDIGISIEELICRLFEHGGTRLSQRQLEAIGRPARILMRSGALEKKSPPLEMACYACDEDHLVELEYDHRTQSYYYCCIRAGDISVPIDNLRDIEFNDHWLRTWLQSTLEVLKPRTRELVPAVLWDLGDATLGERPWSAFLARAVDVHLDSILQALRTRGGKLSGLVLTTSDGAPWSLDLPNHHRFFPLVDALPMSGDELVADRLSILAALRGRNPSGSLGEPGRPSRKAEILGHFNRRRLEGTTASTVREEARQIHAVLMREHGSPEGIEVKTIERHVGQLWSGPTVKARRVAE